MSTTDDKKARSHCDKWLMHTLFVLVFLLICRIIANYFIPLNDATEARYGEIARKMLETGNWVTLQHDYGIPFWAKPPLSTWLSALSMQLFGINEFAVRLPALLLSVGILWLIWDLAKKHSGVKVAAIAVLVLASSLYFFLDAGTVMTDPSLAFCTTLALIAFWHAVVDGQKIWSYVFFIALGLGLLAKGPIVIVLVGIPLFFWILLRKNWLHLWQRLPWIKGTLLLLAIALPWYVLAELRTPGFLNYFIVGEHFHRFLTPGWSGDKYGVGHNTIKGIIWLYAVGGVFPWSILCGCWLFRHGKQLSVLSKDEEGWVSYWLLCAGAPLLFFTFASNVIYPYVFPSLPAFALFFSEIWNRYNPCLPNSKLIFPVSLCCGISFLVATILFELRPDWVAKTQKVVVTTWMHQRTQTDNNLIYWGWGAPFSAQFYSSGKVMATQSIDELCTLLAHHAENYLVIPSHETEQIPQALFARFDLVKTIMYKNDKTLLLHSPKLTC
jgi:4-amino-4-deoxy-L-arabinose transferase-like glycosyltransferase